MWAQPSELHTGPWRHKGHTERPDARPIEAQPKCRKISLPNRGHPHTHRVFQRLTGASCWARASVFGTASCSSSGSTGRCCRTLTVEDSHCESMRLDGPPEQAITRPLSHDDLVQLHGIASQARVAADPLPGSTCLHVREGGWARIWLGSHHMTACPVTLRCSPMPRSSSV